MDLSKLRTDKKKMNEGVWVEGVLPDIDVKVISTSSNEFKKFAQTQMKSYQALGIDPTSEESDKIGAKAFAFCAVKDWRGVTLDNVEIPFTPEAAYKLFLEIPDFLAAIVKTCTQQGNFRAAVVENVAGN